MSNPMIRIHNADIDEIIDREMTDDEFAQYQILQVGVKAREVENEEKAEAKSALLEKLGISEDEAKLLLA